MSYPTRWRYQNTNQWPDRHLYTISVNADASPAVAQRVPLELAIGWDWMKLSS